MKTLSDLLFLNLPEYAEARLFWEKDLAVNLNETRLPYSFYNTGTQEMVSHQINVSNELYSDLLRVSKNNPEAIQILLISAMRVLLFNYTEQEMLEIGIPSTHMATEGEWEKIRQVIPVSLSLSENSTFKEILSLEKEKVKLIRKYQYFPIQRMDSYRKPKISVAWNDTLAGATDINFIFEEAGNAVVLKIVYNTGLFSNEWINIWGKKYLYTISVLLASSNTAIKEIDLLSEDEIHKLLIDLNNTSRNYLEVPNLKKMFERSVFESPDKTALVYGSHSYTYLELDAFSNRIAHYLIQQGIGKGDCVALFMKKNHLTIAGMLGILKAGASYVAISPEYPLTRIKFILEDANVSVVLSSKNHIKVLNKLQWETPSFSTFLCLDSIDVYAEKEEASQKNEFNDPKLWEYIGEKAENDIEGGGWQSSFTGENFSAAEMEEYQSNVLLKLRPHINSKSRIMEIGCASGITMFGLAPHCGFYYGTDLSSVIIRKNQAEAERRKISNIKLACLSAGDIDQLDEEGFDIVIINSVAQCFDGHNYLRDVLKKSIALLNKNGKIFLGDLMDEDSRELLLTELARFKEEDTEGKYRVKLNFDQEMFYSRKFIDDLRAEFKEIVSVECTSKIHTLENELTKFRFDALLEVNKNNTGTTVKKNKQQHGLYDIPKNSLDTNVNIDPDDLAYILYTSGSTGKPKGVEIRHKSVIRLFGNTNYLNITQEDRIMNTVPMEFDPSVFEIWMAFSNAIPLYVVNTDLMLRPTELKNYIISNSITQCVIVTALFASITEEDPSVFDGLKHMFIGGEALPARQLNKLRSYNPVINITNLYGPTENTVISTYQPIYMHYTRPVPIGKPISDSTVYILNQHHKLVLPGGEGELYLGGDGLAKGYLNRPDITATAFIEHPYIPGERIYKTGDLVRLNEYDEIEFLGRKDSQVKIRGFRIELSEIENCITGIKGVKEAKVIVKGSQDDRWIYAYFTAAIKMKEDDLLYALSHRLPPYMVPSAVIQLTEFPLTTNNKIDVSKLPAPIAAQSAKNEIPENDTELLLMEIWKDILGLVKVSLDDNFFALGGHSLLAMKMLNRLSKNYELKLTHIFEYPTIRQLAPNLVYRKDNLMSLLNKVENVPLTKERSTRRSEMYQEYLQWVNEEILELPGEKYPLNNVLLTGATGYLGIHLLQELLVQTEATIYVLIRAENKEQAMRRLSDKFFFYFKVMLTEQYAGRVQVLQGDLSENLMGLSSEEFDMLAYKLDTIINSAANVKHYGQKEDFKMNTDGVRTLKKLAEEGTPKRLQHVSTVGVSFDDHILFTEFDRTKKIKEENSTFYLQSKLEGEGIVFDAIQEGIESNIIRIGNLVSNSETGKFQENSENSAFYMLMHSFIKLKMIPEMLVKFYDFSFVNTTAKGIIAAAKEKSLINDTLHLFSHHAYNMCDLYEGIIKDNFPEVELVPLERFREQMVLKYEDPALRSYVDHILIHIRLLQLQEINLTAVTDRTQKIMKHLGVEWQPMNEQVCDAIVKMLKELDKD